MHRMHSFLISTISLLVIGGTFAANLQHDLDWTTKVLFDREFGAKWITSDDEWITMEMSGPTAGWIAIGFSNNGAMKGSDIVMGWIDENGQAHIKDLHGVGNEMPLEDDSQDVELIGGESKNGIMTIRFRRRWNTCDADDYVIGEQTVKLIWAHGGDIPSKKKFAPRYHGRHERGIKNVNLRLPARHTKFPEDMVPRDPSIKHFDVKMDKQYVPGELVTEYFCLLSQYPNFDEKSQIVGWRPIIEKQNVPFVHHIVIYECVVPEDAGNSYNVFQKHVGRVESCFAPNMPTEWMKYCWVQPIVWTIGGEGEMFPSHTGMPLGEKHGGSTYFMMEFHYDNPELVPFTDSSGIRFYYTDRAREQDLSTVFVGKRFSTFHFIPPAAVGYQAVGGCSKECTENTLPKDGILVTHALLHAHLVTKKIVLRHIRNGVELAPIAMDTNYDINYQQSRILDPPLRILPGDELYTYCDYDTRDRDIPLWGGIETNDTEMCHTFLTYYPKIDLASCQSQFEYNDFLNAIGIKKLEGDILSSVSVPYKADNDIDPEDEVFVLLAMNKSTNLFTQLTIGDKGLHHGKNLWTYLNQVKWRENDSKLANELNRKLEKAKSYYYCSRQAHIRVPMKKYIMDPPSYKKYVDPDDSICLSRGYGYRITPSFAFLTAATAAAVVVSFTS